MTSETLKAGDYIQVLQDLDFMNGDKHVKGQVIKVDEVDIFYFSGQLDKDYILLSEPEVLTQREAWVVWYMKCKSNGGSLVDAIDALHMKLGISMID